MSSDRYEGGRDKVLGRRVVVHPISIAADPKSKEAVGLASAVSHPNIVSILDLEDDAIVYEHLDGLTIRERLAQGPITALEIAKIASDIGAALGAIHEAGLAHGSVKPETVLLTKNGARLAGFGTTTTTGTPEEDQRAFARAIWEAFTAKAPPAEGRPPPLAELTDDLRARVLRARVDAALARAFGSNPYPTCRELGTMVGGAIDPPYSGAFPALRQAELDAMASSHTPSIVPRPTRRIQNVLAGLAVVLIAVLIVFGRRTQESNTPPLPPPLPDAQAPLDAGIDAR